MNLHDKDGKPHGGSNTKDTPYEKQTNKNKKKKPSD